MTHTMSQTIRLTKTGQVLKPGEFVMMSDEARNITCQVCTEPHPAYYDARTPSGRWGYLCPTHFQTLGCRLGIGSGQRLVLPTEQIELV